MTVKVKEFERDIDKAQKRLVRRFVEFHRRVVVELLNQIIEDSPVWTGRFRASNRVAIGQVDDTISPVHPEVANGRLQWPAAPSNTLSAPGVVQAALALAPLKPFDTVIVSNSLPYAARIEAGHSNQAPAGVYEPAVEKIERRFANMTPFEFRGDL